MKLRGFLIIIVLAGGLLYLLWMMQGGKEQVPDREGKEQLPVQVKAYREAELQATKANMLTLKTAIFMFTAEEGQTPKDLNELKKFGGLRGANLDSWGTPIRYKRLSDQNFRLISAGKDKIFDTSDDIILEY
jgi:hypothetical protein